MEFKKAVYKKEYVQKPISYLKIKGVGHDSELVKKFMGKDYVGVTSYRHKTGATFNVLFFKHYLGLVPRKVKDREPKKVICALIDCGTVLMRLDHGVHVTTEEHFKSMYKEAK